MKNSKINIQKVQKIAKWLPALLILLSSFRHHLGALIILNFTSVNKAGEDKEIGK